MINLILFLHCLAYEKRSRSKLDKITGIWNSSEHKYDVNFKLGSSVLINKCSEMPEVLTEPDDRGFCEIALRTKRYKSNQERHVLEQSLVAMQPATKSC